MMTELESKYEELITEILSSITAEFGKDLLSYDSVTSLINVPLSQFNGEYCKHGFLIDLSNSEPFIAGQSAKSGESGDLLSSISFEELISISTDKITSQIADDFFENNKTIEKFTKNLIIQDKKRYFEVKELWRSELKPPVGTYISNIPISPFRPTTKGSSSNPIFGVAYTISIEEHLKQTKQSELIRTALNVGSIALKFFVKGLLDDKLQDILTTVENNNRHIAIASFVLFHHWFYPHKLTAFKVILNLTGNEQDALEIYSKFDCLPPTTYLSEDVELDLDSLIEGLTEDLYALILSSCVNDKNSDIIDTIFCSDDRKKIRECILNVLIGLTCKPKYLNRKFQLTETNAEHEFITALPNNFKFSSKFAYKLPIYDKSQVKSVIKGFNKKESKKFEQWQNHFEELKKELLPNWIEKNMNKSIANKIGPNYRICHKVSDEKAITPIETPKNYWENCRWLHRLHSFTLVFHAYREEAK